MQTGNKITFGIVAVLVLAAVLFFGNRTEITKTGSVAIGGEYQGTTTYNYLGAPNLQQIVTLKSGSGTLGSVIITGAAAGIITFYDASTTANGAAYGSTTLAVVPVSLTAGTYTFDRVFFTGLTAVFSSTTLIPTSTITFR